MNNPELSIVLPCYNEEKNIPIIINIIKKFWPKINFELILVNNGSTDNSSKVLEEELEKKENAFLKVVEIKKNIGYGHGIYTGLKKASAPVLAYSHGDIQTPPQDIFKAFEISKNHNLENTIIKGQRINRAQDATFLTKALSKIVQIILGRQLDDINGQPKLFSRKLFSQLKHPPLDFAFDVYLMYIANLNNYKTVTFEVDFGQRLHGQSKWATNILSKYKTIFKYLISIFKIAIRYYHDHKNLLKQITRFATTGILTNSTNYGLFFTLLKIVKLPYVICSTTGFIAGFIVSFFVNGKWTFKINKIDYKKQIPKFLVINAISLTANIGSIVFFTEIINMAPEFSNIIAIIVSTIINFTGFKLWVFKS